MATAKCTKRFAPTAAMNAKFHSSPRKAGRFTATNALRSTASPAVTVEAAVTAAIVVAVTAEAVAAATAAAAAAEGTTTRVDTTSGFFGAYIAPIIYFFFFTIVGTLSFFRREPRLIIEKKSSGPARNQNASLGGSHQHRGVGRVVTPSVFNRTPWRLLRLAPQRAFRILSGPARNRTGDLSHVKRAS